MNYEISKISFIKLKPHNGHVGFISFVLNGNFAINGQAVHIRRTKGSKFRVLWRVFINDKNEEITVCCPITKTLQSLIDEEISAYIIANNNDLEEYTKNEYFKKSSHE